MHLILKIWQRKKFIGTDKNDFHRKGLECTGGNKLVLSSKPSLYHFVYGWGFNKNLQYLIVTIPWVEIDAKVTPNL